ncbi:DUF3322 and DUF2220 domain-containing protein [Bifidobacterium cuniculi]|uniref:DUF2399 domain-containing protein n=1 Tax=Bifidobacterium cuniculi TaxID=1688 RepID=A0A087AL45_9BIFI|nr:DUF3322 and DUF2220 domain-containing protein [Bifidobacterium cuniculi]KFI59495.1 hypothetical protein BCUN_1620 [Bifidobacterium cuniculi]
MRSPRELASLVEAHLGRHLFDVADPWPLTLTVQLPSARALEDDPAGAARTNREILAWADAHGVATRLTVRRMGGTPLELVSHVTIPDEDVAQRVVGRAMRGRRCRVLARAARIRALGWPVGEECVMRVVRWTEDADDLDFDLLMAAAVWFHGHLGAVASMTAREVPLEGFSGKWLGGVRSLHRRALCALLEVDGLPLRERPEEVRYRYLDPAAAGWAERLATEVQEAPELPVARAIVVENKDTYLAMPAMAGTVCVFGAGFAVGAAVRLLPWLAGLDVAYWGDLDAAGFEILASLRAAGLAARAVGMDLATYERFRAYGTALGERGTPIKASEPKEGLDLTDDEYALYGALCRQELGVPRVEQERIPLDWVMSVPQPR